MALIRSMNRAEKFVGHDAGGGLLSVDAQVHGWHLDMDEETEWTLVGVTSNGSWPVCFVRCKPFTFGPWQIIDRFYIEPESSDVHHRIGRVDNEDQFFFCMVKKEDGVWYVANGSEGFSDASYSPDGSSCGMWWYNPAGGQGAALTVLPA